MMRRHGVKDLHIKTAGTCSCGSQEVKFVSGVSRCSKCDQERIIESKSNVAPKDKEQV